MKNAMTPTEVLRTAFATLIKRQRANVRKNLAAGLVPLCGDSYSFFITTDANGKVKGA